MAHHAEALDYAVSRLSEVRSVVPGKLGRYAGRMIKSHGAHAGYRSHQLVLPDGGGERSKFPDQTERHHGGLADGLRGHRRRDVVAAARSTGNGHVAMALRDREIPPTMLRGGKPAWASCASRMRPVQPNRSAVHRLAWLYMTGSGPLVREEGRPGFARIGAGVHCYNDSATVRPEVTIRDAVVATVDSPFHAGPLGLRLTVVAGVPTSWIKTKERVALAGILMPIGKPDCSKMVKFAEDSLNGVLWVDDAQLVSIGVSKRYGRDAGATLTLRRVEPAGHVPVAAELAICGV